MPRGVYQRTVYAGKPVKRHISKVRQEAALVRWQSVKEEREQWLKPFRELPIDRAMPYLEDLRKICEDGGHIMNERINHPSSPVKCAGPRCGKNLEGTNPSGRPKWIKTMYIKDPKNPEIGRSIYFCSELCANGWARARQGAMGTDGR
jgi:hypothetical protein